jgi:CRP/FNR family transcriptional regulator
MRIIPKKKRRALNPGETRQVPGLSEHLEAHFAPISTARILRDLSPALLQQLYRVSTPATYTKGHVLFTEGEPARGVFLIEQGRVRLAAESSDGKSLILNIAVAGQIVGLPASVSGRRYEATAETTEWTEVKFVPRKCLLSWIQMNGEAGLRIAEVLSEIYFATYQELRYLGLSRSAEARLARFLLSKPNTKDAHNGCNGTSDVYMTHHEIAAVVGLSRETVTRLLADFKRRGLVRPQNSHLTIQDAVGLEQLLT